MTTDLLDLLEECREAERAQALFYRRLGSEAEAAGDVELAGRFHGLHADEQHHLSRLSARLVELGVDPREVEPQTPSIPPLQAWEAEARGREREEIHRYEQLLARDLDYQTRGLVDEILHTERRHEEELGGKWTMA